MLSLCCHESWICAFFCLRCLLFQSLISSVSHKDFQQPYSIPPDSTGMLAVMRQLKTMCVVPLRCFHHCSAEITRQVYFWGKGLAAQSRLYWAESQTQKRQRDFSKWNTLCKLLIISHKTRNRQKKKPFIAEVCNLFVFYFAKNSQYPLICQW